MHIEALRRNYIAYFRVFRNLPQVTVHEGPHTTWIVANGPPGNQVLRTAFTTNAQIPATLAAMQAAGAGGVRWLIYPGDTPSDLPARLEAHGLRRAEGDPWMFAEFEPFTPGSPPPPRAPIPLRIERVRDEATLADWVQASEAGFGQSAEAAAVWRDAYRDHGWGEGAYSLHYVGYAGERPVAAATLVLTGEMAGIYDVCTAPAARRRGFGTMITEECIFAGRLRGYRHFCLQPSEAGWNLYERLGFSVGFKETLYHWQR